MSKLCANKTEKPVPSVTRFTPKTPIAERQKKNNTKAISPQEPGLLEQAGKILSFTKSLWLALKQNQWAISDCEFLLKHLWDLQEQLASFPFKPQNNFTSTWMNKKLLNEVNVYKKEAVGNIAEAIAAVNSANSCKLDLALKQTIEKMELLIKVLKGKLERTNIIKYAQNN